MKSRRREQDDHALCPAYEDATPTPHGWKRKLIPRIVGRGLYAVRTDVVFIAPNGEEFTSKHQLTKYLKAHKASPAMSEFIWITEDAPRRSTRLTSLSSKQQIAIIGSNISGNEKSKVNKPISKPKSRKKQSKLEDTKYIRKSSIDGKNGASIDLRGRFISRQEITKSPGSIVDATKDSHVSNRNIDVKYYYADANTGVSEFSDEVDPVREIETARVRPDPRIDASQKHFDSSDELSSLFDVSECKDTNMSADSMGDEASTIDQQYDP